MGSQGDNSVIHRKAQVAREDFDAREMSPAKALRVSLAKAADRLFGLALTVSTVEQLRLSQTGIEAEMGADGLLILLDGPEGVRGAAKLDVQMLAALIEVQLLGQVRAAEAEARPVTPTDAAMTAPLIDALFEGFAANLAELVEDHAPGHFRFGDRIEDGRTLALALNAPEYELFRLTLDLGPGAKTGVLRLILPHRPAPGPTQKGGDADCLATKLEENTLNAPVILDAVLGRVRLPLNKVCDWAPGALVPLDPDSVTETQLLGARGHVVARVKMGQLDGFRAVRLLLSDGAPAPDPLPDTAPVAPARQVTLSAGAAPPPGEPPLGDRPDGWMALPPADVDQAAAPSQQDTAPPPGQGERLGHEEA